MAFLKAKWKYLAMVNYEIDPAVLIPMLPKGTELDLFQKKAYVSLVGFMFLDTYVWGLSIPFHRHFEEVNLRFYVRSLNENLRGVAFVKEIVPRKTLAWIARLLYNENYVSLTMKHHIEHTKTHIDVKYQWKQGSEWQHIHVACQGEPEYPKKGSESEFITEHYWGYCRKKDGQTLEYQVEHPPWRIWEVDHYDIKIDTKNLYGPEFVPFLEKPSVSVFLAEGSDVTVFKGKNLCVP